MAELPRLRKMTEAQRGLLTGIVLSHVCEWICYDGTVEILRGVTLESPHVCVVGTADFVVKRRGRVVAVVKTQKFKCVKAQAQACVLMDTALALNEEMHGIDSDSVMLGVVSTYRFWYLHKRNRESLMATRLVVSAEYDPDGCVRDVAGALFALLQTRLRQ